MSELIVGFSRPKSKLAIGSLLIRLFDRTPYSHVYVRWYSSKYDRDLIYEAKGAGINFTSPIAFKDHVEVVVEYKLQISEEVMTKVVQYAIDNARDKYGYSQLLGIALVKIARKFGWKIKNPLTGGTICSELVGSILEQFLQQDIPEDLNIASPKDIEDVIKLHGEKL